MSLTKGLVKILSLKKYLVLYSLIFSSYVQWSENMLLIPTFSFLEQPLRSRGRLLQLLPTLDSPSDSEKHRAFPFPSLALDCSWNKAEVSQSPFLKSSQVSTYQPNSFMLVLQSSKMSDPLPAGKTPTNVFFLNPLRSYTLFVFISAFSPETTSNCNWLLVFIFCD